MGCVISYGKVWPVHRDSRGSTIFLSHCNRSLKNAVKNNPEVQRLVRQYLSEKRQEHLLDFFFEVENIHALKLQLLSETKLQHAMERVMKAYLEDEAPRKIAVKHIEEVRRPNLDSCFEIFNYLCQIQEVVLTHLSDNHWQDFLKEEGTKVKIEPPTSEPLTLQCQRTEHDALRVALEHRSVYQAMLQFMMLQHCEEVLEFYIECEEQLRPVDDQRPENASKSNEGGGQPAPEAKPEARPETNERSPANPAAMRSRSKIKRSYRVLEAERIQRLYDKYLDEHASLLVNISPFKRRAVQAALAEKPVNLTLATEELIRAQADAYTLMRQTQWHPFLDSAHGERLSFCCPAECCDASAVC